MAKVTAIDGKEQMTVMERMILLGLLPGEGDITTLRIVRKLREDLSFSEQEHKDLQISQADGQIKWDQKKAKAKPITLGPKATRIIVKTLKTLNEKGKLLSQHLDLYDRFVEARGEAEGPAEE